MHLLNLKNYNSIKFIFYFRFLWYFPRPIYSYFEDLEISNEEEKELDLLIDTLGRLHILILNRNQ